MCCSIALLNSLLSQRMSIEQKSHEKLKMSEIDKKILKKFDIKSRLGKGAYGIVWKATDIRTQQIVAIKKIFDAFRNETDAQRTFREIMFLKAFRNHPNIIQLHSFHSANNHMDIYLSFEFMDSDLHNAIKRGTVLNDKHKTFIMYQLLNAINYIHSGNVIHRDLKPSNILLDTRCRCKIADFGLARSLSQRRLTTTDSIQILDGADDQALTDYVATRWYRAPEILVASKSYTKGIDLWSLGCILGEMMRGKPLFPGNCTINQVEMIIAALPEITDRDIKAIGAGFGVALLNQGVISSKPKLDDLLIDAPAHAQSLVKQLLIVDPAKRLTAKEALNHKYIQKFRYTTEEPELSSDVLPPLRDSIQLSVEEYRSKLYELLPTIDSASKMIKKRYSDSLPPTKQTEMIANAHKKKKSPTSINENEQQQQRSVAGNNKHFSALINVPKSAPQQRSIVESIQSNNDVSAAVRLKTVVACAVAADAAATVTPTPDTVASHLKYCKISITAESKLPRTSANQRNRITVGQPKMQQQQQQFQNRRPSSTDIDDSIFISSDHNKSRLLFNDKYSSVFGTNGSSSGSNSSSNGGGGGSGDYNVVKLNNATKIASNLNIIKNDNTITASHNANNSIIRRCTSGDLSRDAFKITTATAEAAIAVESAAVRNKQRMVNKIKSPYNGAATFFRPEFFENRIRSIEAHLKQHKLEMSTYMARNNMRNANGLRKKSLHNIMMQQMSTDNHNSNFDLIRSRKVNSQF